MRHLNLSAEGNIIECGRPAEDLAREFFIEVSGRTNGENLISIYIGNKYREENGELKMSFGGLI